MNKTMTVTVGGKQEQREVLHMQQCPHTHMMIEHPVTYPGERIERLLGGEVQIIKGAH